MTTGAILWVFAALMVAMFMFSLNQTVLATALPTIVGELHGVDQMLWVSTAFMLASTIMMPIYGKIGDLFGRKPLFIFAISMFMLGSVFALLAQDMSFLIIGRVFQGIGGGGMMILSQAIIAAIVPARERGKYMGAMGSVFAVSSVAGPLIGGWLTEGPGWRWNFAMNFPLGIFAIIAAMILLRVPDTRPEVRPRIDVAGMALIAVFTSAVVLIAAWGGHQYEWTSPVILGLGAAALVAGTIFVFVERRAAEPIIPMSLFRDRNFVLSTIAGLTIGVAMFGVLSYMPTYLQMVHGVDAARAGLMMVPMMGCMLIVSTGIGFVVARTGRYKFYPIIGMSLIVTSLVLMSQLRADSPAWTTMIFLAIMGSGLGLSMQLLVLVVQNSFPVEMVGTATASNNFFRQIGASFGMAIIGSLFTSRLMSNLTEKLSSVPGADASGLHANELTPEALSQLPTAIQDLIIGAYNDALVPLFLWAAPLPVLGLLVLFFIREKPLATRIERAQARPGQQTRSTIDTEADSAGQKPAT
ncbi:DHA2 family efflux MFS transporter permease subunit [Brevibacterium luteolum]|uniref:MFS transporter n=2 Tax=Brevibacterium luteolum TaxID=199591 RepID=A0A6G8L0H0_9MICO|nr:MFS transporter [Brevibacterium luteolum]QIN30406.1 DHA2 family efflux MFS transporter permease subunit [Brevibacterium luteolum]